MTMDKIRFGQVNLTTCDREPIHIPGSIQPHGVLLVVERSDFSIAQYAGETQRLLGVAPGTVLESNLFDLFEKSTLTTLLEQLRTPTPGTGPAVLLGLQARNGHIPLTASFHAQGRFAVIELEPAQSSASANSDPLALVKTMLAALQSAKSVAACCQTAAAQVRAAIGFSRVMVYQFLHDGSGKVMAEDKRDGLDSFFGLHYPASDVPEQARALYRRNWLRLIPDIDYLPAPLIPAMLGKDGAPLDMSHCALRSLSPLHLEYLRNMGVSATMAISIMIGNELWGIIACHNDSARHVTADLRLACELFGQLFSLQLDAKIEMVTAQRRMAHQHIHAALANSLPMAQDIAAELVSGKVKLLDLISAGGVAVWIGGKLHTLGEIPPTEFVAELVLWLNGLAQPVIDTFQLGALFPPALPYAATACGLLAVSLSRRPNDYVIWFRPEVVRTITWAGDPNKAVEMGPHGDRLTPRKSFAAWQDEVRQQSMPWDVVDLEAAHAFRLWLLETVLRQMDMARQDREASFTRQSMLMAELDHRVKNTLANIQALVRQTKADAISLEDFALGLEMRIRAMARAHDLLGATSRTGASVRTLIEEELAPFWSEKNGNRLISGADLLLSPKAAMPFTMVMHELVSNAAKYGALSTSAGSIDVSWRLAESDGALMLTWKERNGPVVTVPTRRGFGSVVIERSLRHELKGCGTLSFDADGVGCEIMIPGLYIVNDANLETPHV